MDRGERARAAAHPTLERFVRQVDFVICLYTTLPVHGWRGVVHAHTPSAALASPRCRIAQVFYGDFCNEPRFIVAVECCSKILLYRQNIRAITINFLKRVT